MPFPVPAPGFRSAGRILVDHALTGLRLAQRYPLTIRCLGEARYLDPDLEQWSFERSITLGTCKSFADAMTLAVARIAQDELTCGADQELHFTPLLITILDAEQGLALAGEVVAGTIAWCQPVACDAEARAMVTRSSRQRAEAQRLLDRGQQKVASRLRRRACAGEGRLVDPFWRDTARDALFQRRAADAGPH